MNKDTFAPELEVVLVIPIEQRKEGHIEDPGVYEKLGRDLVKLLANK